MTDFIFREAASLGLQFGCLMNAALATEFEVKDAHAVLFAGPEVRFCAGEERIKHTYNRQTNASTVEYSIKI